jgi:hypothetical protein
MFNHRRNLAPSVELGASPRSPTKGLAQSSTMISSILNRQLIAHITSVSIHGIHAVISFIISHEVASFDLLLDAVES